MKSEEWRQTVDALLIRLLLLFLDGAWTGGARRPASLQRHPVDDVVTRSCAPPALRLLLHPSLFEWLTSSIPARLLLSISLFCSAALRRLRWLA